MASILDGDFSQEYVDELIALETSGKSRADNLNRSIRRMTINNPLLEFIKENEQEFRTNTRTGANRCIVYIALLCCSYELFYDLVSLLGKYFHVQDEVSTTLIRTKLTQKYGNGENVARGLSCSVGMLVDAGLITRTQTGIYQANRQTGLSEFSEKIYKKAFLYNNSTYNENDEVESNSFFEFIR